MTNTSTTDGAVQVACPNWAEPFWIWSLETYAKPTVAATLLHLQEDAGLNVNIALWSCWLASKIDALPDITIREAMIRVAPINKALTAPIRGARQELKTDALRAHLPLHGDEAVTGGRVNALYEQIKTVELEIERLEQAALARLSAQLIPKTPNSETPQEGNRDLDRRQSVARRNLSAYARLAGAAQKEGFTVSLIDDAVIAIFPTP